jgi:hypothetical protein
MILLKKEKEAQQEEIKMLKERIEELSKSGHKTPSKLPHKIAKYPSLSSPPSPSSSLLFDVW